MTLPSNLPLSHELLNYYRERIERAEQDYQDALVAIEKIKVSHEDYHKLAWELHQRMNEIADLQKALSDAQTFLFEERRQLLKVMGENDDLRVQELKDRKKIRYLLSAQVYGGEEETTYFKDGLEKRLVRPGDKISAKEKAPRPRKEREEDNIEQENDIEALRFRVKSLKAQLDEQSTLYEETIDALKQDRAIMVEEEKIRRQHDTAKIEELFNKIKKLQNFCRENTKELIQVKKAHQAFERMAKEERAKLLDDLTSARFHLGEERGRNDTIEKAVESKVVKKNEAVVTELRNTVGRYENELRQQKQKMEVAETENKRKMESLKSKMESINSSYKSLKKRRDYEIEGFTNDIQILRKQLRTLEKQIQKYGPVEDKELSLLNMARETGEKAAKISSDLHELKARMYEAEREVQSLAF